MIINTANAELLAELATHSKPAKGKRKAGSLVDRKKVGGKIKAKESDATGIKRKLAKMMDLSEEEIQEAVRTGLISNEQIWNWIPSNIDCLREGIKDIENGHTWGPYTNVDELILSLKP